MLARKFYVKDRVRLRTGVWDKVLTTNQNPQPSCQVVETQTHTTAVHRGEGPHLIGTGTTTITEQAVRVDDPAFQGRWIGSTWFERVES
jgi:hypothetical protein